MGQASERDGEPLAAAPVTRVAAPPVPALAATGAGFQAEGSALLPAVLTTDQVLALQRTAGNRAVTLMLQRAAAGRPDPPPFRGRSLHTGDSATGTARGSEPTATHVVARAAAAKETPQARNARLIADEDGRGIIALAERQTPDDVAALEATTPGQRAGMIRVLTDMTWTGRRDEAATVELLCWRGAEADVARLLNAAGYRQKVLDSVDDEQLHKKVESTLGAAAGSTAGKPVLRPPEVERALSVADPNAWHVRAISPTAIRQASHEDRLRLLTILLQGRASGPGEETRMLEILELSGSDLPAMMADLRGLGYKQALFDHIDAPANQSRLVALLTPLRDPEIASDLEVFQRSARANFGEAIGNAWDQVKEEFSDPAMWGEMLRGIVRPVLHPLDTVDDLLGQGKRAVQEPSFFAVVTLLRDVFGSVAVWLAAAGGVIGFVGGLLSGLGVTAPLGIPVLAIGLGMLSGAGYCGAIFAGLAVFRFILDAFAAGASTTQQELSRQERRLADDIPVTALVLTFEGLRAGTRLLKSQMGAPEAMKAESLAEVQKGTDAAARDLKGQSDSVAAASQAAKVKSGVPVPDVANPAVEKPGGKGGNGRGGHPGNGHAGPAGTGRGPGGGGPAAGPGEGPVVSVAPRSGRGQGGLQVQGEGGGQVQLPKQFPGLERPPVAEPTKPPKVELPPARPAVPEVEPPAGKGNGGPWKFPGVPSEPVGEQRTPAKPSGKGTPPPFQDYAYPRPTKDVATERGLLEPPKPKGRPGDTATPKPEPGAPEQPTEKAEPKPTAKPKSKRKRTPRTPRPPVSDEQARAEAKREAEDKAQEARVKRLRQDINDLNRDAALLRQAVDKLRRPENHLPDGKIKWDGDLTPEEREALRDSLDDPDTATVRDAARAQTDQGAATNAKIEEFNRESDVLWELRRPLVDKLRAGLTQTIKDKVHKRDGKIDKVTGRPVFGTPDIDHIWPLSRTPEIEGFMTDLTPELQKEGANLLDNLCVADLKVNRKRQDELWSEYVGRSKYGPDVLKRADEMEAKAKTAIEDFIKAKKKR
jgi:hypothetical protein